MAGIHWNATAVGFGLRGANDTDLTIEFTNAVNFMTEEEPEAPIVFNYSPTSTLDMLQEFVPIGEECEGRPGRDLVRWTFLGARKKDRI